MRGHGWGALQPRCYPEFCPKEEHVKKPRELLGAKERGVREAQHQHRVLMGDMSKEHGPKPGKSLP